jgi:hypothetical protein
VDFIEIASAGSLFNYYILLGAGETGDTYFQIILSQIYPSNTVNGISYTVVNINLRDGPGDAILLVNSRDGSCVDCVSYEGTFPIFGGGRTTDIGVQENSMTPSNFSLQKCPNIPNQWTSPLLNTKGWPNKNCTPAPTKAPPTQALTKAPVPLPPASVPVPVPVSVPVAARRPCGLFGWSIFCPFTGCGLVGRWIGLCRP